MKGKKQKSQVVKKSAATIGNNEESRDLPVIIVGIGASAGGLKSLERFFAAMPAGRGIAFVLIRHLAPAQENLMVKVFTDRTPFAAVEATDGMPVLPDRIHIIPPDKFLNIKGNILTLQAPVLCNGLRMPIDHFFCSLAADQYSRSIGIVLSGAGADGTLGLSEIKAAGGKTFAEDPGGAEYPGMPQSAIDAGVVDETLPAAEMAKALMAHLERIVAKNAGEISGSAGHDANLRAILDILRCKNRP